MNLSEKLTKVKCWNVYTLLLLLNGMPIATNFENQDFDIVKIFTCYIMTKTKNLTTCTEEIIGKWKTEQKEKK